MRSTSIRGFRVMLVLVSVMAGCGGGGPSDGATSEPSQGVEPGAVDEGAFIAELDRVCLDMTARLDDVQADLFPIDLDEEDPGRISGLAEQASEVLSDGADRAGEITPPEDLQDQVEAFLALLRDEAELFLAVADAASNEDPDGLDQAMQGNEDLPQEVAAAGEELGLECFADRGDPAEAGPAVQAYCDQVARYVDEVDAYVADPAPADVAEITALGSELATAAQELSASAGDEDIAAFTACSARAADAALQLGDALAG